jgi:hypothetical protein
MGDLNNEPSMEDILASIKRVIAEDGRAVPATRASRRQPQPDVDAPRSEPAEEDVLELSDPVTEESGLISQNAASASRQSLAALAALRTGSPPAAAQPSVGDGPLEAVVKDMLRPMIKDWLDQRLPDMVEDLVTREIARITGKSL